MQGVVHLVRHSVPDARPDVAPSGWALSDEGLARAERLVPLLPPDALLTASTEPKAWQTLLPAGREVLQDARFGEVRRPDEPWSDGWRAPRRAWVEGVAQPGWETAADVAARFDAAVADALAAAVAAGRPDLVAATHSMVLTCWLVHRGVVPAGAAAAEFWDALRLPDLLAVDLPARTWRRLVA